MTRSSGVSNYQLRNRRHSAPKQSERKVSYYLHALGSIYMSLAIIKYDFYELKDSNGNVVTPNFRKLLLTPDALVLLLAKKYPV